MMREPVRDPRLQTALAKLDTTDASCDVHALSQRITRGAGMALLRRRYRTASAVDHILEWTRAALPLCVVIIVAGLAIISVRMYVGAHAPSHEADVVLLDAAAHSGSSSRMLEYVVTPSPE